MLHHYTHRSAQCICALCYMWNLCGVVVFHGSMLNWRRGWGQSAMGICVLCYIYIWNIFGVIVFQRSMLNWRRGQGQSAVGICELCYIYVTYWVYWFSRDLFSIGGGGGVNLPWVYVHCAISAKCGIALFKHLCSIGGGGVVILPWADVHSARYETYLV